jgi:hypothetical protein
MVSLGLFVVVALHLGGSHSWQRPCEKRKEERMLGEKKCLERQRKMDYIPLSASDSRLVWTIALAAFASTVPLTSSIAPPVGKCDDWSERLDLSGEGRIN